MRTALRYLVAIIPGLALGTAAAVQSVRAGALGSTVAIGPWHTGRDFGSAAASAVGAAGNRAGAMLMRWVGPLVAGVVAALLAFQITLVATPRFLMVAAVRRVGVAGMNRMFHGPLPTAAARQIVRPSPDLAYSSCPFDLSHGPVAVHVAPAPAAYWSLSVFDQRTDVAFVRNNGETGGRPLDVVIARRGQAVPEQGDEAVGGGPTVVRVDGSRGIALIRILVDDRSRFAAIDSARRHSTCGTPGAAGRSR